MEYTDLNLILDVVLILAAVWMIFVVRGLGGVVGRTLNLIVAGTIVLGLAHLAATVGSRVLELEGGLNSFIHRLIVLGGFVLVVVGFRQIRELKV